MVALHAQALGDPATAVAVRLRSLTGHFRPVAYSIALRQPTAPDDPSLDRQVVEQIKDFLEAWLG